jgi:hypothetical protein
LASESSATAYIQRVKAVTAFLTALLVAIALTAAACAKGPGGATSLTISVAENGKRSQAVTYTLRCRPAAGTHPNPAAACAALDSLKAPFAKPLRSMICTQIWGGPERAWVSGRYRGAAVSASFSRQNGCEIARWDAMKPVLGR